MPGPVALRHNPVLKTFGERPASGGLPPKAVVGAAMRKLIHNICAVIKSGKPFAPHIVPKGLRSNTVSDPVLSLVWFRAGVCLLPHEGSGLESPCKQ